MGKPQLTETFENATTEIADRAWTIKEQLTKSVGNRLWGDEKPSQADQKVKYEELRTNPDFYTARNNHALQSDGVSPGLWHVDLIAEDMRLHGESVGMSKEQIDANIEALRKNVAAYWKANYGNT